MEPEYPQSTGADNDGRGRTDSGCLQVASLWPVNKVQRTQKERIGHLISFAQSLILEPLQCCLFYPSTRKLSALEREWMISDLVLSFMILCMVESKEGCSTMALHRAHLRASFSEGKRGIQLQSLGECEGDLRRSPPQLKSL